MRVRFYDSQTKKYGKSEVYAIINSGYYEKQLLLSRSETGAYLKFYDYLDQSSADLPVLINTVIPEEPEGWIYQKSDTVRGQLEPYKALLDGSMLFFEYHGFPWLWDAPETLTRLLNGEAVPLRGSLFEGRLYSDIDQPGWTFVESQEDADAFQKAVYGLHDSVIKEIQYTSGAYVSPDKSMYPLADKRRAAVQIQSQLCPDIELVFEGVTALNLRPDSENFMADIFDSTLLVEDASVFFCDSYMEKADTSYQGTWIAAYSLKWRFAPPDASGAPTG